MGRYVTLMYTRFVARTGPDMKLFCTADRTVAVRKHLTQQPNVVLYCQFRRSYALDLYSWFMAKRQAGDMVLTGRR